MNNATQRLKNDPSLVWIEPPKTELERIVVAEKIWSMIENDYCLSVPDICALLDCKQDWVRNHLMKNVKHIFLNYFFRQFMHKTKKDAPVLLKNYYYFSKQDLLHWLDKNTVVIYQTVRIPKHQEHHPAPIFSERAGKDFIANDPLPDRFISMNSVKKRHGFSSPEIAYRKYFEFGYPKFRIDDSLIRYDFNISFLESELENTELYWAKDVL